MSLFPGTPGTPGLESRNCPETVPSGVPGLWELITPDCGVWSWRGLNQTCSPRRDLFNDVLHSQFGGRKEVDCRLLVVGSQTASLTPGPSFAHNLGCRCPNGQCEAIFDIYASRPFQWHQELLNTRCFGSCCWALNIRESRRTPNPQLWKCWASPHTWPKWGCDTQPHTRWQWVVLLIGANNRQTRRTKWWADRRHHRDGEGQACEGVPPQSRGFENDPLRYSLVGSTRSSASRTSWARWFS